MSPKPSLPLNVSYYAPINFLFSLNQLEDKFGSWLFGAFFRSHSIEKYLNAFRCKHLKNISLFLLTDILKGLSALGQLSSKPHKTFAAYRICCCLPRQQEYIFDNHHHSNHIGGTSNISGTALSTSCMLSYQSSFISRNRREKQLKYRL